MPVSPLSSQARTGSGRTRCARYGASLGRAFQITDDVLDYSGHAEDIGKRLGDDLREGKVTLPLIHALRSAAPEQRELVARAVREGNGDFGAVARIVTDNGSLAYSLNLAQREAEEGRSAIATLPGSECQGFFATLARFRGRPRPVVDGRRARSIAAIGV